MRMEPEEGGSKLVNGKYREFLLHVYTESHHHLREQTTKRDQVIAFYVAVLAFLLSSYGNISAHYSLTVQDAVMITVIALGVICYLNIVRLRSWQLQYSQCCSTVGKLMVADTPIDSYDDVVRFIRENNTHEPPKSTLRGLLSGVENMVVAGFAVTAWLPALFWFSLLARQIRQPAGAFVAEAVAFSAGYFFFEIWFFYKTVRDAYRYNTWITNFEGVRPPAPARLESRYLLSEKNGDILTVSQKTGGVVILPMTGSRKILFVRNKRERIGRTVPELPRGFMEKGETAEAAARRELREELHCTAKVFYTIGKLHTDSGFIADNISVIAAFRVNTDSVRLQKSEHILAYGAVTGAELLGMIRKNEITDNFTLSAVSLAISKGIISG